MPARPILKFTTPAPLSPYRRDIGGRPDGAAEDGGVGKLEEAGRLLRLLGYALVRRVPIEVTLSLYPCSILPSVTMTRNKRPCSVKYEGKDFFEA